MLIHQTLYENRGDFLKIGGENMKIESFFAGLLTGILLLIGIVFIVFTSAVGISWGLNKGEVIQMIASTATVGVSLVSIWIALRSLKVSKESLLQNNRPYVVIYLSSINSFKTEKYVVIKNFGKSGATITGIHLDLLDDSFGEKKEYIHGFVLQHSNSFIAPNQAFQLPLFNFDIVGSIFITYVDSNGFIYEEKYELDSTATVYRTGHSSSKLEDNFQKKLLDLLHNNNRSSL